MSWGKTLGEMTPEERREAIGRATARFQTELDATAGAIGRIMDDVPDTMTSEERELHDRAYASADDCDTCWYLCSDQTDIPQAQVMIKLRAHFASGHLTSADDDVPEEGTS